MPPIPIGHTGPTPWQIPALAAVACAAALALACCALVLFAPDQHAVRRLIRRAVPLAATAAALSLACALAIRGTPLTAHDAPEGGSRIALDVLLLCGWYVVALSALTLARAYTIIAGGPLRLQPTSRMGDILGRPGHALWTTAPPASDTTVSHLLGRWPLLLAILTAASLVLPLVATGPIASPTRASPLMPDVATALLIVAANAAAALAAPRLARSVPRASRALLTAATLATALSLAHNLSLLLVR